MSSPPRDDLAWLVERLTALEPEHRTELLNARRAEGRLTDAELLDAAGIALAREDPEGSFALFERATLRSWTADPDLALARDEAALERWSPADRTTWRDVAQRIPP